MMRRISLQRLAGIASLLMTIALAVIALREEYIDNMLVDVLVCAFTAWIAANLLTGRAEF